MITKHVALKLNGVSNTLVYAKYNCIQLYYNKSFAILFGYFMYKLLQHQTVMPTREEKLIKYKTTNKSQPEPARVDNPNPKLKTK
jgi:hypothetical protein